MQHTRKSTDSEHTPVEEKLLAILKICQKMNSERNLEALLDLIAREATRLVEAERASIFLLDPEQRELWSKVALGSSEIIRFDARLGIAGAAAMTGETINVREAKQDPRFYPGIDARTKYRTRNVLATPLVTHEGKIIGTFQVLNKLRGAFALEDEQIIGALAAHAAIAIENAQLLQELSKHRDQLLEESTQLRREVESRFSTQNIIGTSEKIQHVVRMIEHVADTPVNVLVTGESGTGKELVAKAIHYGSSRARCPFVAVNCAALPEPLVESELFGIEKGVATGVERRIGKMEAAQGGTLFLDEVGDLSLTAQAKILRALQERLIERVGGRKAIAVDLRVLAATNKDLEAEIKRGHFREDLYYRLKVIHIQMPPLREIQQDIPMLANYFLTKQCQEMGRGPMKFSSGALTCITTSRWPGNIRELENEIKRLIVSTRRTLITEEDLSPAVRGGSGERRSAALLGQSLRESVEELERRMLLEALHTSRNNQQQAARLLGLSRQGLIKKIKRYGIKPSRTSAA